MRNSWPISGSVGLDQPLYIQLWTYLKGAVQFDLGFSYRQQMPVSELIASRLPATLLLTGVAFVLSLVFGVIAGVAASARQGSWGYDDFHPRAALLRHAAFLGGADGLPCLLRLARLVARFRL